MINIQNIRFGHACNSSSTHSIILFPGTEHGQKNVDVEGNNYGWSDFVLAGTREKLGYIGTLLWDAISHKRIPEYIWDYYVNEWLDGVGIKKDGYVDHQSQIRITLDRHTGMPNMEFFNEFKDHILDDHIVIYGGNDNRDEGDSFYVDSIPRDTVKSPVSKLAGRSHEYEFARKDPHYGYWSLYNQKNGTKIRFAFDDRKIECASIPELVDMKITNRCQKNCDYCYQDSTKDGHHASLEDVKEIIRTLSELQVWEVALGGGEVTEHPDFPDILEYCYEQQVTPNFTTRNINWFKNDRHVELFKRCCGQVAFSVDHPADLVEIHAIQTYHNLKDKVSLQCVDIVCCGMGKILQEAGCPVILLGYKPVGRGAKSWRNKSGVNRTSFSEIHKVKQYVWGSVGVDTKYLQDHLEEIRAAGVFPGLYTVHEGLWSMYVDAVDMKMGESSYCNNMVDFKLPVWGDKVTLTDTIASFFAKTSREVADRMAADPLPLVGHESILQGNHNVIV